MKELHRLPLGLIFLGLIACGPASEKSKPPVLDLSSPDRAVESIWAFRSWDESRENKEYAARQHPEFSAYAPEVEAKFRGQLREAIEQSSYRNKNRIVKVEQETSTRALVHASERLGGWSSKPEHVTYVLTKVETGWVINDKRQVCWLCNGIGKREEIGMGVEREYSVKPMKVCNICHGEGWVSLIFD